MTQKSLIILTLLSFTVTQAAMANITPTRISGGLDPAVDSWSTLSMEAEEVSLKVEPARFEVEGRYWLRNPETTATSEEIGYPYDSRFPNELRDFSAWVNDQPVEVRDEDPDESLKKILKERSERKEREKNKKIKGPIASVGGGAVNSPSLETWKIWKVKFPALGENTIRVKYSTLPKPSQFNQFSEPLGHEPSFSQDETEAIALATGDEIEAKYILWTGARWQGKIKKGVIQAQIKSSTDWQVKLEPKPKSFDGKKAIWTFQNFKPGIWSQDSEIVIKFQPRKLSSNEKIEIFKKVALAHPRCFEFCAEVADKLDELGGTEVANLVRMKSIEAWTSADSASAFKLNTGFGYDPNPVLKMAWQALQYSDTKADTASASTAARIFRTVLLSGFTESDTLDVDYNVGTWPQSLSQKAVGQIILYANFFGPQPPTRESYDRIQKSFLKYGVSLESSSFQKE